MPHRLSSTQWPLVGRSDELDRLTRLRTAASGVVLSGPAGIGKSRLMREALAVGRESGVHVEWVQATRSAAAVPLGALASLLDAEARSTSPLHVMRSTAEGLRARAGTRPIVLGVDDAQLLDSASAALVLQLVTTRTAFVLATLRSGEPVPDAIVSLWKDAGAVRMDLQALDEAETGALIESALGGPVEQAAKRWLFESSYGNVLYIRELLVGALEGGALVERDGLWRLPAHPPLSRSLTELVNERISGLDDATLRVLQTLALGEPLTLADTVEIAGESALISAERDGLVTVSAPADGDAVRLAHPLYGEVIRAALPLVRGHELRVRLAAMVQARAPLRGRDALKVARWLLDAGEAVGPDLLTDAARAANAAGDPTFAAHLAQRALAGGASSRAALALARAHIDARNFEAAEAVLAPLEGRLDGQDAALEYLEQRVIVLFWGLQRHAELPALLERAQTWWPGPEWYRRLVFLRMHVTALDGNYERMTEVTAAALTDPELDDASRQQIAPFHGRNLLYSGRTREGYEWARARRPQLPLRDFSDEVAFAVWISAAVQCGYDWPQLEAELPGALVEAVRADDHAGAGLAAFGLGGIAMGAGRFADAARWLTESELHFGHHDAIDMLPIAIVMRVKAEAGAGEVDTARTALQRLRVTFASREGLARDAPHFAAAEAAVAAADGDRATARRLLAEATEQVPHVALWGAQFTHDALLEGAEADPAAVALEALRERCDAPLVVAFADHARARADDDAAALVATADRFEALGAQRAALLASVDAAQAFLRAGDQDSARRAAVRADALHVAGQGTEPPQIEGLGAVALSPRERQLVDLAAQGLTSPEIAEQLVLSVRTVESHLYRAMNKLGISDRRELAKHQS
ncbi:LuxR C-terminal-related transcriptional regulator [Solirubrobacter phytolaccae]|uniref:LuxR C-terminal-related transcriptional regulator n=1 Tax=Solirubrobacter phytolaccae TaxID=1404360 RepID=A0A9X3S7Y8_9ACTN|nr:LuxR family transcriptional regulator [Solirubrobacter phytolaccae]MDA0180873.1 LuxR C-terminal-related transcriptional regulator [Solirubrobacter phytolaccae]